MTSRSPIYPILIAAIALGLAAGLSACGQAAIDANSQQVQQQQALIEQNQMEIQKLMAQQGSGGGAAGVTPPPASTGCDKSVMATATRHGGEKMASGDFAHALGYYQDALTACPGNPRAELNVARAYEAAGNRSAALAHFRAAAASTDPANSPAEQEARNAMARMGAN
ncbi:MAG TPA: tetratricopeptide repeat protein [Candidatus Binataceae bacterium]|nr:tetratricopeptide repeat protein [Candidatus Binataceae bacterium]